MPGRVSIGSWCVYEISGQRRLTRVCRRTETFVMTSFGTFDLRTGYWVAGKEAKAIFIGTHEEAEEFCASQPSPASPDNPAG